MFRYKTIQSTFRNNRLYAPGEFIESEKVIVSRALVGADEATKRAIEERKVQIATAKAQTPDELRKALALANEQLLKYKLADAQAEISRREAAAAKPAEPERPQKAPMPAPRRVADQ